MGDVPPEWQYNVGEAAWAQPIAEPAFEQAGKHSWANVPEPGPAVFSRPEVLPATAASAPLADELNAAGV